MLTIKKIFSFATLTLLVALTLSTIAAWYSVLGLTAIFAAAVGPVMIMGGSLEFAKVITTLWLHKYWNRAGWKLKLYLVPAVIMLAFLTSMGIFGFLSKAHSDHSLVSGDVQAKIVVYDEKIKTAKDNIEQNRKALQQMDAAVDQVMGRSTDVVGAQQSTNIRKSQLKERTRINKEIEDSQQLIAKLNDEAIPIRAQVRKVEAEVGPIKYIAALIYGDNPDNNLLERAVRWVIIVIVFVFDPLALTLVLAAQSSYKWLDEDLKKEKEDKFKKVFLNSKLDEDSSNILDDLLNQDDISTEATGNEVLETKERDSVEKEMCVTTGDMYCMHDHDCEIDKIMSEDYPENIHVDMHEPTLEQQVNENDLEPELVSQPEIQTHGVTIHEMENGYVQVDGKQMNKSAYLGQNPQLFMASPNDEKNGSNFGTSFPLFAAKGDVFVRVDALPNRVYKFDGSRWMEINKDISDSYLYDEEYLKHLVGKIESGEYDVDLLSENEKAQIEDYLYRLSSMDK